jgi:ferrous iron transport protein A
MVAPGELTELINKSMSPEISAELTLDKASPRQRVKVAKIVGGWGVRQRLNQLSIHIGSTLIIKRNGAFGGPILVSLGTSEVAIGRGLSRRIMVNLINDAPGSQKISA